MQPSSWMYAVAYLRSLGATKATRAKPGVLVSDFLAYVHLHEAASTGDYALAALKKSGARSLDRGLVGVFNGAQAGGDAGFAVGDGLAVAPAELLFGPLERAAVGVTASQDSSGSPS